MKDSWSFAHHPPASPPSNRVYSSAITVLQWTGDATFIFQDSGQQQQWSFQGCLAKRQSTWAEIPKSQRTAVKAADLPLREWAIRSTTVFKSHDHHMETPHRWSFGR
jgi:hypothetical protein